MVEKQYRMYIGDLLVAYRAEEKGGRLLYILGDALTTFAGDTANPRASEAPVPPCIQSLDGGTTQLYLEIEDRCETPGIFKITSDHITVHVSASILDKHVQEEIVDLITKTTGARLTQVHLERGLGPRSRIVKVRVDGTLLTPGPTKNARDRARLTPAGRPRALLEVPEGMPHSWPTRPHGTCRGGGVPHRSTTPR